MTKNQNNESGPIPDHHKQWFEQLKKASANGDLALMSCVDLASGKNVSVICLVGQAEGNAQPEVLFTPIGHLCTEDNPFEAYQPPAPEDQEILSVTPDAS